MNEKLKKLLTMNAVLTIGKPKEYSLTEDDIDNMDYFLDENINNIKLEMYLKIISWLDEGISLDEIIEKINEIDYESFKLDIDKQKYVKNHLIRTLNKRKENMKGNDRNE